MGTVYAHNQRQGAPVDKHRGDTTPGSGDSETTADQREQAADVREGDLDARESQVRAREDAGSERANQVQEILAAADKRDERADARDRVSTKRDMAANLKHWLHRTRNDEADETRRFAWDDRNDSKRDRTASADDRETLAEGTGTRPSTDTENS
jgi:hypothetical protein